MEIIKTSDVYLFADSFHQNLFFIYTDILFCKMDFSLSNTIHSDIHLAYDSLQMCMHWLGHMVEPDTCQSISQSCCRVFVGRKMTIEHVEFPVVCRLCTVLDAMT